MMFALTVAAMAAAGITLGLLGGGGSILTVPVLIYLAGLGAHEAITTSLFVVAMTSVASLLPHARAGRVRWRTGLLFGGAGTVGAYAGGRLAGYLPGGALLAAFAVMMAVTAIAMLRRRERPGERSARRGDDATRPRRWPKTGIAAQGAAVGLVTGLVGAGGGFVVVPALILLGGMAAPEAVGTSLVVIAMNSLAGLAGHLGGVHLDWTIALAATGAAVAGSLAGARWTGRVDPAVLRRVFGWFVIAMAAFMLAEEAPARLWHALLRTAAGPPILSAAVTAAAAALVCRTVARPRPSGPPASPPPARDRIGSIRP